MKSERGCLPKYHRTSRYSATDKNILGDETTDVHTLALSGNVVADVSLLNGTIDVEARSARATTSRLPDTKKQTY